MSVASFDAHMCTRRYAKVRLIKSGTAHAHTADGASDQIVGTSDQIAGASDQIAVTSDQIAVASDQIAGTSDQITRASDQMHMPVCGQEWGV